MIVEVQFVQELIAVDELTTAKLLHGFPELGSSFGSELEAPIILWGQDGHGGALGEGFTFDHDLAVHVAESRPP